MKIAIFPADNGGCGHYRLIWPGEAVSKISKHEIFIGNEGPDIRLKWDRGWKGKTPPEWVNVKEATMKFPVDVIVIQRPLNREMVGAMTALREKGVTVVVDMDDNFDRVDPRNAAWFSCQPYWHNPDEVQQMIDAFGPRKVHIKAVSPDRQWFNVPAFQGRGRRENIHEVLKVSNALTASTEALQQHYGKRIPISRVLTNYVPERYLEINNNGTTAINVGWTGTLATHPDDFKSVGNAIAESRKKHGFNFKIVGGGEGFKETVGVEPDEATGWVSLDDYPDHYGTLDIVLCPLQDTQFNAAKSWLKPLEAAALGVVPIMSPLPEYQKLADLGIGVIARRDRDWKSAINDLVSDREELEKMKTKGREIASELTYEKNGWRWERVWEEAYESAHNG